MTYTDYLSKVEPIWCKGCGNFGILKATCLALSNLEIPPHKIGIVSGIGCSSRMPGYLSTYGINSLHGRAIPIATGLKLARPDLTVLVAGGDGDLFSIGAGHLPHVTRRKFQEKPIDITCIMFDNHVYALTKGQTSPTTFSDQKTKTTDFSSPVDPLLDMLSFMHSSESGFLAQGIATDPSHLTKLIEEAIKYKGFSFINVQTPCPTHNSEEWLKILKEKRIYVEAGKEVYLPDGERWIHDPQDWELACKILKTPMNQGIHLGIIYKK